MIDYNFIKLNQLCSKITDGSHYSPTGIESGIPMLSVKDMLNNGFSYKDCKYVSREDYHDLVRADCKPLKNDILIAKDGSYLKHVFVIKDEIEQAILSSIGILRPNLDKIHPEYIKYYLQTKSVKETVAKKYVSGSALPRIILRNFGEIDIIYKPLSTQKSIAKVLSDLDAKIEVNNKINAELEAMAKTLYDYWFVQFDFPNAQGKPYKTSGGKMVFNQELKREIPEGWEVDSFANWIANDKSGDWGKETKQGNYVNKVSCIRGADLNGINGKGEVKSPTRFILEKNNHKLLEIGDFIIEISGGSPTQSTGRMAFITQETLDRFDNPLICSNFCKAVTLKEEKSIYNFAYEWNRLYDAGVLFGWEGKTSGIKNLLFESFVTNHKVALPQKDVMELFYEKAKPIHAEIQKNLKQNQKLSELRDWLLPMLMNGQVTVKQAQQELAKVAEDGVEYKKSE